MTSFGTTFGSAVSATGSAFSEAFESYRRAQYLVAGSAVAATDTNIEEGDEESAFSGLGHNFDESDDEHDPYDHAIPQRFDDDSFVVDQFDWDEDRDSEYPHTSTFIPARPGFNARRLDSYRTLQAQSRFVIPAIAELRKPQESTPLLSRKASLIQEHISVKEPSIKDYALQTQDPTHLAPPSSLRRRSSATSQGSNSVQYHFRGKSTYGQTLFNSIAILLGIGMLSEPLAFAYAGWAAGTAVLILYALISCYTAKILAAIILADPRLRSYSDIGRKAFGPRATGLISFMFCLELFAVTVILVTLYADSLNTLIPQYSEDLYKVMGLVLLIPTAFMPLSLLSYTSILGIFSTIILVFVIFVDGFSKKEAPGSLWSPAPTSIGFQSYNKLGLAYGLFMAGFSGHPVIPSLARDMADPTQFDHMISWAFGIATFIYIAIGSAGYLMFGDNVHDEISIDLLTTVGYEPILNHICLWLLVISPLSKFGLNTQPLTATIDILLGLDTPNFNSPDDLAAKPEGLAMSPRGSMKRFLAVFQRVFMTALSVLVSIMVPEFSSMMAFLGSFSAFMLAVVGPVLAKVTINGRCSLLDGSIIVLGTVMAVWGTLAACWAAS